jgi:hypothetical protein
VDPAALGRVSVWFSKSIFDSRFRITKSKITKSQNFPNTRPRAAGSTSASRLPALTKKHPISMVRKLKSGEYRLYSRKKNVKTGKPGNLGTFSSKQKAEAHERAVQYFKRH